jgi:hypothetical protein
MRPLWLLLLLLVGTTTPFHHRPNSSHSLGGEAHHAATPPPRLSSAVGIARPNKNPKSWSTEWRAAPSRNGGANCGPPFKICSVPAIQEPEYSRALATDDRWSNNTKNSWYVKRWTFMFEKLKDYQEVHGDCLVPSLYVCDDGTKLGRWVVEQRNMQIKDAALREQRRRELDAIGFVWVIHERTRQLSPVAGHASKEERFNARWNSMFDKLKEYKAEYGDCLVPRSYNCTDGTRLGLWVSSQRSGAATDSAMNPLRRRALSSIGFVWQVQVRDPSPKLDEKWNEKFRLLQEYHAEHGDCLVPYNFITANNILLGKWVSYQRVKHAAGKLHEDRLIQLESLDFSFRALPNDSIQTRWDRLFERLARYKRENGHCRVPFKYMEDQQLGRWVSRLRYLGENATPVEQRAALEALGFCWTEVVDD